MVVRFAYDFNDQQLEEIAKAIDGNRKRRKGAKPRKASRKECLGLIEGALKRALVETFAASERLPAEDLNRLARGEQLEARAPMPAPEKVKAAIAPAIEKLDKKAQAHRDAENLDRAHRSIVPVEEEAALKANADANDPPCLRRGCGKPKSAHSKFRQCPGKRAQIGVFDLEGE